MKDIVIYGAGGFGREVAWLIEEMNREEEQFRIIGFVDDDPAWRDCEVHGYPVLGGVEALKGLPPIAVALAVGNPSPRMALVEKLKGLRVEFPNLVHPSVLMGPEVALGMGNILCAGVIATANIRIGNFCHFNLKTSVGHDCVLEDFSTTACGVDFAGYSHASKGSYFGNHATLLGGVKVGALSVIGAGAVVHREIPPDSTAVGVPARVIETRSFRREEEQNHSSETTSSPSKRSRY